MTNLRCFRKDNTFFLLRTPPRAESLKVNEKWHVAFHGTSVVNVLPILNNGELLLPGTCCEHSIYGLICLRIKKTLYCLGDYALGGKKLREADGHFTDDWKPTDFDTKQIFLSPTMKYSGSQVYSKKAP